MGQSFGLLKPDCLKRGIENEVLGLIESSGLDIIATKRVRLTRQDVDILWESCKKMDFYEEMVDFSTSGDCIIFIVEGENAINKLNDLVGHYEPLVAKEETIRHLYGTSAMKNVIHSSEDEEKYKKEKAYFFKEEEFKFRDDNYDKFLSNSQSREISPSSHKLSASTLNIVFKRSISKSQNQFWRSSKPRYL